MTGLDPPERTLSAGLDERALSRAARQKAWVARTSRPLDILALVFLGDAILLWSFPEVDGAAKAVLDAVAGMVWAGFALDYFVRLSLSPTRGSFVRTHKLDLLMVLLPMLRLLRVVLLLRKSLASVSTEKIAGSILSIVVAVVFASAYLEWRVEHDAVGASITTFRQAMWWAVVTTTTVGYGDYTPVTQIGRLIGAIVMMVGIGLIGTVSATVAAWFVTRPESTPVASAPAEDAGEPAGPMPTGLVDDREARLIARLDSLAAEQLEIRRLLERITSDD